MNVLNARHVLVAAMGLIGVGSIVHCSAAPEEAATPAFANEDAGGGPTDRATEDAGSAGPVNPLALDTSKGLILVHGSPNLPAFRLCFGTLSPTGYLTGASSGIHPLPDRELMPDSNVVGVEIGSAVRLKPLDGPGLNVDPGAHVFAFPEIFVRAVGGTDLPCNTRICPVASSGTCLPQNPAVPGDRGFYDLGPLPPGAVDENVQLLAFHGCVPGSGDGGAGAASCGADYDPVIGNAKLDLIPLMAYKTDSPSQFFVQVAQLSGSLVGSKLSVGYGDLAKPENATAIPLSTDFGQIAPQGIPNNFDLDRTMPGIYASQGFQIGVGAQVFAKSLAEIQLTTAPQAVPNDLYSSKSNFVLLLLGDPALSDAKGNALSSQTDPGLLLHLLVVSVGQPDDGDAGIADAGGG